MALLIGIVIGFAGGWVANMLFGESVQRRIRPEKPPSNAAIHTAKAESGWEVQQEGRSTPIAEFPTKVEAQAAGREIAKDAGTDHIVHKADGTVAEERHYGDKPVG